MEKVTLQEFNELAYRAFYWTSFTPDKRGEAVINGHENELNADLAEMPEEEKERYITDYKRYFSAWLSAHSNCASSAITGGSGFNVGRAEKANRREHAAFGNFIQWRERALKAIEKKQKIELPEYEKKKQDWNRLKNSILSSASTIREINDGINRYSNKSLFVSSIYNKVETYARNGDIETVGKAVELLRELNKVSPVITERHRFFKLPEVAEANREKITDKFEKEGTGVLFKGGKVINNYKEDRIQIIFDEKPSADIISRLKKSAFKWSPRFGAWQRQMTVNAAYAAEYFLKNNNLLYNNDVS
ncbi:MAG: hypothetical protein FWF53_03345 [Candidatus Azobacteroides sp.]|nr:hypothetical protein [Candidatus Azobacteroides sp.]